MAPSSARSIKASAEELENHEMTTTEKGILTAYFGQPDVEDCSSDAVPNGALSAEGKQTIQLPEVVSMTKVFFEKNRLQLFSFLRTCLRNGTLQSFIGLPIKTKYFNRDTCAFPYVTFWRIDRTDFWADVDVRLTIDTTAGPVEWKGVLSVWCRFDTELTCTVEELTDSVDRRAEGCTMLSPFLVPYLTNKQVDEAAEEIWKQNRQEALLIPNYRDPVKLAERMGLRIEYYPLYNHQHAGAILFFADSKLQICDNRQNAEEAMPRTIHVIANTIVVNTNAVRSEYSGFNIYHECFHYEYHYLFYRLQDMYNTDIQKIKTIEIVMAQGTRLSDPVYFMEKQADRGAFGLALPATATQEAIREACNRVKHYRHAGEKYQLAGKALAREFDIPHFRIRARMIQLGHIEAKGALNYAEKKLIQPFAFDVEAWREEQHTFVVDRDTVSALMRQNDDFRAVMQSGSYIYADGHVVRNDPRFVKTVRDQLALTDWANAHVDECCLRFVRVYVQQNVGKYIFGRMYYDADYVKQTQFYLHDLINQEHLDELEAKYRYCRDFPISFRDAVDQLRNRKGLSLSSLSEQLNMDKATLLRRLDDPKKYRNEDFLTVLSLLFGLPDWLSRLLFKRAGLQLDDDNRRHQALAYILRVQSADGIEAANDFLKRNNQDPLSF